MFRFLIQQLACRLRQGYRQEIRRVAWAKEDILLCEKADRPTVSVGLSVARFRAIEM